MILAFLQNLWVKEPERARAILERESEEFRVQFIRRLLFHGGLTGKRIQQCFGDLTSIIIFEEATREISGDSKTICPPDPRHIAGCLDRYRPVVVLTFGKVASDAVAPLWKGRLLVCPHPAARQRDTVTKLQAAAEELTEWWVENYGMPAQRADR